MGEEEVHLLFLGNRFQSGVIHRSIGGAHNHHVVPRNREEDPAVVGVWHHDGGGATQESPGENQMDPLARLDHPASRRIVHSPEFIREDSGGVDHDPRLGSDLRPRLLLYGPGARYITLAVLFQPHDPAVIQEGGALARRRLGQIQEQPGVVELTIVIDHAPLQSLGLDGREALDGLLS